MPWNGIDASITENLRLLIIPEHSVQDLLVLCNEHQEDLFDIDNFGSFEEEKLITLNDVINLSSPDYALVAISETQEELPEKTIKLFSQDGCTSSMDSLLRRWDHQHLKLHTLNNDLINRVAGIENRLVHIESGLFFRIEAYIKRLFNALKKQFKKAF